MSEVLPEFEELHGVYTRATEVRDKLQDHALEFLESAQYAELLGHYASLCIEIARLLVFLRSRVRDFDWPLYQLWMEASKR